MGFLNNEYIEGSAVCIEGHSQKVFVIFYHLIFLFIGIIFLPVTSLIILDHPRVVTTVSSDIRYIRFCAYVFNNYVIGFTNS